MICPNQPGHRHSVIQNKSFLPNQGFLQVLPLTSSLKRTSLLLSLSLLAWAVLCVHPSMDLGHLFQPCNPIQTHAAACCVTISRTHSAAQQLLFHSRDYSSCCFLSPRKKCWCYTGLLWKACFTGSSLTSSLLHHVHPHASCLIPQIMPRTCTSAA